MVGIPLWVGFKTYQIHLKNVIYLKKKYERQTKVQVNMYVKV